MSAQRSSVTLRALRDAVPGSTSESPLANAGVRGIVRATAEAIAERVGVKLVALDDDDDSVTATLEAPQVVALGFAAELRRLTEQWHRAKYGRGLWGEGS
ncbi:MAG: hypothetical protein U0572_08895 [Phycisphaerales bacterium]